MMNRRQFITNSSLGIAGIFASGVFPGIKYTRQFKSKRPGLSDRKFVSEAVEETIALVKKDIADPEIAWMFENCFPNTLDTTVNFRIKDGRPDTFVITGDIHAMWLRDSTAQVWPYLPLSAEDEKLRHLIAGVVNRQVKCILIDPYANAFNDGPAESPWKDDLTDMKPELHERKWEIDSLCYPVRLAYNFWKTTGDISIFDKNWLKAAKLTYRTFIEQQRKEGNGPYKFQRVTGWQTDTVAGAGYGNPVKPNGLICSIFRPSDDATIFPFLIPSNFFAVKSLEQIAEIATEVYGEKEFALQCVHLAYEVKLALHQFASFQKPEGNKIFAYEIDGFENALFIDDANVPSLLSMPYLGLIDKYDPVYFNTRKFVLSEKNPYFFKGSAGEGVGGPHAGMDMIWPMSIIMRAFTTDQEGEITDCLRTLKRTHAGTGFMHESFHKNDPENFTRKWFAWANTLFGELILKVKNENSEILQKEL